MCVKNMCDRICIFKALNTPKLHIIIALICGLSFTGMAQDEPGPPHKKKEHGFSADRLVVGGDIGLNFGTITFVNLSPTIGYKITDKYIAGLGPVYIYFRDNINHYNYNIYGGCIYNRYYLFDFLFLHGEYQPLNGPFNPFNFEQRIWINNLWVGGGLRQTAGNASLFIMCLFNVNESDLSYPRSPWIRGGIAFGL